MGRACTREALCCAADGACGAVVELAGGFCGPTVSVAASEAPAAVDGPAMAEDSDGMGAGEVPGSLLAEKEGAEVQEPATLCVDGSDTTRWMVVSVDGSMPLALINSATTALSSLSGLPRSTNR